MLVVEPFVLLQYEPAKLAGKPLRISDGEARLADDGRAGVPHSHHVSGLNCRHRQDGEQDNDLNQAVQNLTERQIKSNILTGDVII